MTISTQQPLAQQIQAKLNHEKSKFYSFEEPLFFVTTIQGFENVLKEELEEIFCLYNVEANVTNSEGGCYLVSSWEGGILTNLASMCASRVYLVLAEAQVNNVNELYSFAKEIDWTSIFQLNLSFSVKTFLNNTFIKNSMFVNLKIKDAICDHFRDKLNERPNVNTKSSDIKIIVHLSENKVTICVDTTGGDSLSYRGYKEQGVEAPLREYLAANLLRISGWNKLVHALWNSNEEKTILSPFLSDPMCGSGTFVIEAALAMLYKRPNVTRSNFSFLCIYHKHVNEINEVYKNIQKNVLSFEKNPENLFEKVQLFAEKNGIKVYNRNTAPLRASDISSKNVDIARSSAKLAGVDKMISFNVSDIFLTEPHASHGIQIINPPYGIRIGDESKLFQMYAKIGDLWKQKYPHWVAYILSGNMSALKKIGLRPNQSTIVHNGNLKCKYLQFEMYPKDIK